ncbi:hypothetical protein GJ496_007796 [Pomphorhynchus laevis]|nr:hypothetical protein GJ496_007796 [Pomphorhynchus laevis]
MYNSFNAASSFIGQIRDQFIQLCTNHELLYNLLFSFNIITFGMLIDLRRFNCEQESLLHLLNVLMSSPHFKINRFSKCLRLSGNKNLYNLLKAGQINRHYPCCGDFSNEIPMPLNMQDIEDDLSISMTDYDESLYSAIQRVYAQLLHATNRNRLNEILLNFDQSAIDQSVNNDVKLNPYADKKLQALLDALLYSESRRIDSICLQERQIEMSACAAPDTSTQHSYIDNQPSSSPICSCVQINENECLQSTRNGESFYESRHFIPNGSQLTNCSQMPIFGEQIRRQIANTFFNGNNSVTDLSVETLIAYLQNCTNIHTPDDNMFLEEPNRNFTVIYLTAQAVQKYPYLDPHSKVPRQKYEMVHFPRGHCLILNYMHFTDHETRRGTDLDALKLQRLFEQLGFIVILRSDLYYLPIHHETRYLSNQYYSKV